MSAPFIYMGEVLVCSGLFAALYSLLLERKVGYLFSRLFLTFSVLASVVIPLLNIPIYTAEVANLAGGVSVGQISGVTIEVADGFDYMKLLGVVYFAGVIICLGSMLLQFYNIFRISYKGERCVVDGITIVRSDEHIASFSFFSSIFISKDTLDEDLETIIAHERSHIAHYHSVERLVMEIFKALLWWNPFVWMASRRLTEVEEFEADHDVINGGCDAKIYVTTLLKHLFGYSPEIANGIHNSLTKKRLKMILKNDSGRYALLRKLAVIPVLGTLVALFSFTTKEAVAQDVPQTVVEQTTEVNGYQEFYRWVVMNIIYPAEAKEKGLTGTVYASLTIGTDGKVKDVKIVKSNHELFTKEVQRVLAKAPNWKPFVKDGEAVEVKYMLPLNFILEGDTPENLGGVVVKSY